LTVAGVTTTAVYNKTTQTNSAATVTGLKGSDTATIGGSYGSGINVGVYTDALSVSLSNPSDYTVGVTNGSHTITPAIITVNGITAQNKVYDATTAATLVVGTITTSGVLPGDTVTLNTSTLSGVFTDKNVGNGKTVLISGVVLAGANSSNYQLSGGANTTTTANITPAPLSITGSSLTTTYNGSVQSLVAPTVTGLIAGDNVIASGNATGTNAGTYTATYTATGVDAGNYTITSNAPVLTINKASLVVAANNAGKFYGQADPTFTATVSGLQGSDTATASSVTSSVTGTTAAPGTYPSAITASGVTFSSGLANNYTISYLPGSYTITPAGVLVITMNAATTTYATAATPTVASVQFATGTGTNTTVVTLTKSGDVYTDGSYSITVTPVITSVGVTPVVSGSSTTWNVGTYANAVSNTNNYTSVGSPFSGVSTITNTLTITPAPLALTVANVSKTYDANAVTAAQIAAGTLTGGVVSGASVTSGALMNGQTIAGLGGLTFSGSAIGAINASSSTYPLNASVGSGFSNYNVTITNGALTINKAPLVINGAVTTTPYNGAAQTNTAATVAGLQGSDNVVVSGYATATHVSQGAVSDNLLASGASASNYTITYNNGSITITPASLLVTGVANQYAYNGALQTNGGASVSGLKGADTATVSGYATATHVSQGIVSDALVATLSNASDYTVTYAQGSLQITPVVINAVVNSATVMYNAASQTTGFVVTGLKGSDTATAASGTATGTNVGTYTSNLVLNTSSDYTIGTITNGTLNITPAPLTISAGLTANNKVYDTTTAATIAVTGNQALAGVLGADAVTVSSTGPYSGATFSQSNVGSGLTVTPGTTSTVINGVTYTTMAGVTLTGAAAGNYYVAGVGPQTLTANITPKPITIATGLTASNKVYDGTTAATITSAVQTLSGVIASDAANVSVSSSGPYTGTFSQSNVGTNLTVTPSTTATTIAGGTYNAMSGVTLTGSAAGNYYVTGTTSPITANITPYIIDPLATTGPRVVAIADNKVYTSTNTANGTLAMAGLFGTDSVSVSYTGATFASPNVANGITVTFAGVTLSGASASNYQVSATATAPANITPAPLTVSANDQASLYTQPLGTLSVASAIGLLGGQTVTGATLSTTAATSGPNSSAGTYPITISAATGANGFSASNYSITYVPATYTIVPAGQLLVSTSGLTTVYGSTVVSGNIVPPTVRPSLSYLTTGGTVIPNSSFTWQSQTVAGNVVTYTYSDGSGHTVTFNLTPTGTTTSTSGNIKVGSYGYAASNISAPGAGLTSTTGVATGDLVVTPLAVTITAPTVTHAYNGAVQTQPVATASPAILTNDVVTIGGAASGKNVGVYGSNLSVTGVDSTNYSITLVNANLTITPFIIGSGGASGPSVVATANNKVYDTTTAATGALAMTNLFPGDAVLANYGSAAFATANVNALTSPQTVTFSALTLSGAAAGNYAFATSTLTATASITPAPVTISGLTAQNKVYTSTTAATVTGTPVVTGLLGSDTSTASGTVNGVFASPNVANGIAVAANLAGLTLSNSNYYITGVTTPLTANITPAPLTISSGLTANSKVYDTTNAATIGVTGTQTLAGVLGSDAANLSVNSNGPYIGTFSQVNVGAGLTVTPATTTTVINGQNYTTMSGASLSGSAAGNYYIAGVGPQTLTAAITKAPLTITANNQASFVTQNIGTLSYSQIGLLGSDAISGVTLATTATSSSAANTYPVTASAATGAAMANYQITYVPGTYTIVPAGQVLITTTGTSTVYGTAASFANPAVAYATSNGTVINPLSFVSSVTVNGVTTYTYSDGLGTPTTITFNFAPVNPVNSASGNLSVNTYGLSAANFTKTGSNVTSLSAVVTGDLTVTPRPVTISAIAATYQYNGSTRAQLDSISSPGIIAGDAAVISGLASGKNVGTYGSGLAVSGADTKDYLFTLNNANLTITPYIVNFGSASGPAITATANSRVYNTTTTASGALAMTNLFPGDVVNVGYTSAAFYNANVGSAKTVTFNGVTLSGPAAANYAVGSGAITAPANITPAPVTISGLVAANKQYNGNTVAEVTGTPVIAGILGADALTLTGKVLSGTFATSNPGTGLEVTANLSSLSLDGLAQANYYIAGVTFPLTADITSPPQTINNMTVVQQQVAQVYVPDRPTYLINKGELIYVRDKDNLTKYLQAIEVPASGAFKFPVQDQIIQDLINLSGENVPSAKQAGSYRLLLLPQGSRLLVTLPDGSPLPSGIKYDVGSKSFTVPKLGEVTLPLSVKVSLMRGNEVLSDKIMVVTK